MVNLCTLEEISIPYEELNSIWKCDKRHAANVLRHFIALNKEAFDFIGVRADIDASFNATRLLITTSHYAGTVPLLSPRNGKSYADLTIRGRFGEDISGLLTTVQDSLLPEYDSSLPDIQDTSVEPPLYFECCRFIDFWQRVEKAQWCKFEVIERERDLPTSGTRWDVYAQKSFAPEMALKYPTRESRLSKNHLEFRQLVTVLLLAISEVQKIQTPIAVRSRYLSKTTRLSSLYGNVPKPRACDRFVEHASDPQAIREAKRLANVILQHQSTRRRPWRVDYAILFEYYVQHLFREVAEKRSCSLVCSPRYSILGRAPAWALRYLEPDIVLQREDNQFIIDAKYKSHMLNRGKISDGLKESFRHDLHQVLAYSSFGTAENKQVVLVYPAEVFVCQRQQISNPLTRATTNVHLVGVPLDIARIGEVKRELDKLIARSL